MAAPELAALEGAIDYTFRDRDLLLRALTHKSHAGDRRDARGTQYDNEQLEFLGDAVLGLLVSEWLLEEFPDYPEGRLSIVRAGLVSAVHLHESANEVGLGEFLQLGRGEEMAGGRSKRRLLANAVEALIAALYIDGGSDAARRFVREFVIADFDGSSVETDHSSNSKGPLQEKARELGLAHPRYEVLDTSGPEHSKVFTVEARIGDSFVGRGEGTSKKAASQKAARALLEQLETLDCR